MFLPVKLNEDLGFNRVVQVYGWGDIAHESSRNMTYALKTVEMYLLSPARCAGQVGNLFLPSQHLCLKPKGNETICLVKFCPIIQAQISSNTHHSRDSLEPQSSWTAPCSASSNLGILNVTLTHRSWASVSDPSLTSWAWTKTTSSRKSYYSSSEYSTSSPANFSRKCQSITNKAKIFTFVCGHDLSQNMALPLNERLITSSGFVIPPPLLQETFPQQGHGIGFLSESKAQTNTLWLSYFIKTLSKSTPFACLWPPGRGPTSFFVCSILHCVHFEVRTGHVRERSINGDGVMQFFLFRSVRVAALYRPFPAQHVALDFTQISHIQLRSNDMGFRGGFQSFK